MPRKLVSILLFNLLVILTAAEPTPEPEWAPTGRLSQFRGFVTPYPPPLNDADYMYASVWASWSAWSFCSNGVRIRVRACNTVKGFSCLGPNQETTTCWPGDPAMMPKTSRGSHRDGSHSDYDVVDPYEDDRKEAYRQLYTDDDEVPSNEKFEKLQNLNGGSPPAFDENFRIIPHGNEIGRGRAFGSKVFAVSGKSHDKALDLEKFEKEPLESLAKINEKTDDTETLDEVLATTLESTSTSSTTTTASTPSTSTMSAVEQDLSELEHEMLKLMTLKDPTVSAEDLEPIETIEEKIKSSSSELKEPIASADDFGPIESTEDQKKSSSTEFDESDERPEVIQPEIIKFKQTSSSSSTSTTTSTSPRTTTSTSSTTSTTPVRTTATSTSTTTTEQATTKSLTEVLMEAIPEEETLGIFDSLPLPGDKKNSQTKAVKVVKPWNAKNKQIKHKHHRKNKNRGFGMTNARVKQILHEGEVKRNHSATAKTKVPAPLFTDNNTELSPDTLGALDMMLANITKLAEEADQKYLKVLQKAGKVSTLEDQKLVSPAPTRRHMKQHSRLRKGRKSHKKRRGENLSSKGVNPHDAENVMPANFDRSKMFPKYRERSVDHSKPHALGVRTVIADKDSGNPNSAVKNIKTGKPRDSQELEDEISKIQALMKNVEQKLGYAESDTKKDYTLDEKAKISHELLEQKGKITKKIPSGKDLSLVPQKEGFIPGHGEGPMYQPKDDVTIISSQPMLADDSKWSGWSKWGECFCGKQVRTRVCHYLHGTSAQGCPGSSFESRDCEGGVCPTTVAAPFYHESEEHTTLPVNPRDPRRLFRPRGLNSAITSE